MPDSLKSQIKSLWHKGKITDAECKVLLERIDAQKGPSASSVDFIDRQKTIAEIQYKYYDNAIGIDIVDMIAHMPAAIPEQLGEHFAEGYKKGVGNEQTRT